MLEYEGFNHQFSGFKNFDDIRKKYLNFDGLNLTMKHLMEY